MPLLPLALDIYVKSIQLKGSKHGVSTSTKSNEAAVLSEVKLALAKHRRDGWCRRDNGYLGLLRLA
jgi:hypothetical protein